MQRRTFFGMLRLPFRHQLKIVPDGLFIPVCGSPGNGSSYVIFWLRTIWLRSKRLPFGAMRIGNDLEMSGVL